MTNMKATKRALVSSVLALFLCFAMLLGTTFAWFTDSVTSTNNIIKSGTLDVVLEYKTDWDDPWAPVGETTKLFKEGALYEPGYTETVFLRVSNAGSLALKYKLLVNILEEKGSTNVNGEKFNLSDYLQIGSYVQDEYVSGANYADILMPIMFGSREASLSRVAPLEKLSSATEVIVEDRPIFVGDQTAQVLALVLTMPETVGNEANYDSTKYAAPEINLGVTLLATQFTEESDSFDNQYDKDAEYPIIYDHFVSDLSGLEQAFAEGGNIILTEDIAIENMMKIAENTEVYLDLNGQTIEFQRDALFKPGNPLFYPLAGSKLTITGNGTVDLGDNYDAALVYPAGEVIIENGTFIRDRVPDGTDPDEVQTLFMGVKSVGSSLVINGGYFDSGYYDTNAELAFTETAADIANRGKAADKNLIRTAIKNNTSIAFNLSWSSAAGTQDFRIYGGTFVGANPAWGDEGCAMPITPDYLRPWSYYQGTFLEGQKTYDDRIEIPVNYSITESKTDDGRPVYTVTYKYEKVATKDEVANAIASGKNIVLTEDIEVTDTLNVSEPVKIDLNGKTLTVSRMEANAELTVNGGTLVNGEATYPAISVNDGGKLVLNDVSVVGGAPCNVITSGSAQAAEIVGVQVFGGECVLNNCDIYLDVTEPRYSNSVFAVGIHGGSLTMNGGSITVKSVGSTKEQYDYQSAIFAGGNTNKTITLNDVDVDAKNFLYAWGGNTVVNTTAADGAYTGFDVRNGGTYTVNYNYAN